MPKLPLFLAALALAVVWLLYAQWAESSALTPELLLASARERVRAEEGRTPQWDAALHELGIAVEMAEARGERDVLEEALELRAEVLRDCSAIDPAIEDYRRLLSDFRPQDERVELALAALYQREGDADAARGLVEGVLDREPGHSGALAQLGALHADEARKYLEQCDEILYRCLPKSEDERGRDLARRVASRDAMDPTRVALLQELLSLFDPLSSRDASLAEALLHQASHSYAEARQAFTSAMEPRPNYQAYGGFLDILVSAGRFHEAARFGMAALAHEGFRNDTGATASLARALARTGAMREAAAVARSALRRQVPLEETREWCLLLYRAEAWDQLRDHARSLESRAPKGIAGEPHRREAAFYDGMLNHRLNRATPALVRLTQYTRLCDELEEEAQPLPGSVPRSPDLEDEPPEYVELPFEGARAQAHLALSSLYRRQRNAGRELQHLRRVADLAPDSPGPVWKRIHELQGPRNVDAEVQVHVLTKLLSLEPDPDGKLTDEWHAAGRAALKEDRKDPQDAGASELREFDQWYPQGEPGPYELFVLARDHLRAGQAQGAVVCLRLLLEDYPGFRPAQDQLVELYLEAGRWDALAPLLLDHARRWGTTKGVLETLRSIPGEVLTLEERLERMRLDPLHSGVYAMAEHLAEQGERDRALRALLGGGGVERLDAEGRVLAGRILLENREPERAVQVLFPVEPQDPLYSRAAALRIEASLASDDEELLMSGVRELAEAGGLETAEVLRVCDALADDGRLEAALYLLERLDSQPATRTGEVFLRQAFHHLMAGELDEAEEDLLRAEAYLSGAAPLVGRILVAAERSDWKAIPAELGRIRGTGWMPTRLQTLAGLALEDRLEEARDILDARLAAGRPDHVWLVAAAALSTLQGITPPGLPFGTQEERLDVLSFVAGGPDGSRDAREALVVLLALDDPTWRPWVLRRLDHLERSQTWIGELPRRREGSDAEPAEARAEDAAGADDAVAVVPTAAATDGMNGAPHESPLYPYLRALVHQRRGDVAAATGASQEALAARRSFEPAWELLERIVAGTVDRKDHPTLLTLRQHRRAALGQGEENVAEGLLLEAQELAAAGEVDDAIAKAQWALREDRELIGARLLLTRLEVRAGKYRAAQAEFGRLFEQLPPGEADALVPEYVRALDRFLERGIVEPQEAARDLEALVETLPANPDVALALARTELAAAGGNVHAGVARVWRRLEELRARLAGASLESRSDGAMRRWFDFALSLDARRAEQLVRRELGLLPHSPDLWLMLGEALEAQYRAEEALEQYRALLELLPEKPVLRRATALMAQLSESPLAIQELLYESVDLHGWHLDDPEVRAMMARAYGSGGTAHLDTAIALYAELWEERETLPPELRLADVGQEYGEALLRRGLRSDRREARAVFAEIEEHIVDGPRRDLCRALAHLARHLPNKPEPQRPAADQPAATPPAGR